MPTQLKPPIPLKLKALFIELALIENLVLPQVLFKKLERWVWVETTVELETADLVDACGLNFAVGGQLNGGGLERHRVPLAVLLVLGEPRHVLINGFFILTINWL